MSVAKRREVERRGLSLPTQLWRMYAFTWTTRDKKLMNYAQTSSSPGTRTASSGSTRAVPSSRPTASSTEAGYVLSPLPPFQADVPAQDGEGNPLFVSQTDHEGGVFVGKASQQLDGSRFGYGGAEQKGANVRSLFPGTGRRKADAGTQYRVLANA